MKKIYLLIAVFAAFAAFAATPWWNNQWSMRIPVTVTTGMTPAENALVSVKIEVKCALSSIRVTDSENNLVPCAVRKDTGGNLFVAWRIAKPEMLEELSYFIYCDKSAKPEVTEPAGFPKNLPGMNLLPNPQWLVKDADGNIDQWYYSSKGYGMIDKWNDETRSKVSVVQKDGRHALKIDGITVIAFVTNLEEGHTYRMNFEGFNETAQLTTVTALFYDHSKSPFKVHRKYGNYKIASGVPSPGKWLKSSTSYFGYIDNRTQAVHNKENKLLPGTAGLFFEVKPRGKKVFYLANPVIEDITEVSLDAVAGDVENVQQ